MVDLVWHTLLDGTVTFDIDNITLETFELNVRERGGPVDNHWTATGQEYLSNREYSQVQIAIS